MKKMDQDIISWIIELLLRRRQLPDALINKFLTNPHIPLDNNNLRLKKTILLRSIDSQITDGSVSEAILESLEIIEQLDRSNHIKILDSMKLAYCAVAVECTVKYIWGNLHYDCQAKYCEAVKRIWRDRIHKLEMVKKSDLVTPELRKCKEDLEGSLLDSNVLNTFKERNTRNNALILTGNYVVEAMATMGPPFLQLVARVEREAKEKEKKEARPEREVTDNHSNENVARQEISATRAKEIQRKSVLHNHKHVAALRRSKGPARITDCNELDLEIGSSKDNTLPTPVVKQTQEALKSSSLESQAAVDDPLPSALHVADTVIVEMARKYLNKENLLEKQNEKNVDAASPSTLRLENDIIKPSLMGHNSTAQTFEWHDSINDSPKARTNQTILLDSPEKRKMSPPKNCEASKFIKKKKKWTVEEEDALRAGVDKFGQGNWKFILNSKRSIFADRTEVNLKDKWRNMTR